MLKKLLFLGSGNLVVAILGLARNLAVAMFISVADFGISSTFIVAFHLTQLLSFGGIHLIMVQADDGDSENFQKTSHTLRVLRGLFQGVVLFVAAGPIADFVGVPELTWCYQLIAVLPVIRSLSHTDQIRIQREMNFSGIVQIEVTSHLVSTLFAIYLGMLLKDYRAVLFALLAQQLVYLIHSHILAIRPYRIGWDLEIAHRIFTFSWPTFLSAILVYAALQADRFIIADVFGIQALGYYALAFSFSFTAFGLMGSSVGRLVLPRLSEDKHHEFQFDQNAQILNQAVMISGLAMALIVVLLGSATIYYVYGEKYISSLPILVWLVFLSFAGFLRRGPGIELYAKSRTMSVLMANVLRCSFIPFAYFIAIRGASIFEIIQLGILAELVTYAFTLLILREGRSSIWPRVKMFGTALVLVGLGFLLAYEVTGSAGVSVMNVTVLLALIAVLGTISCTQFIRWMFRQSIRVK